MEDIGDKGEATLVHKHNIKTHPAYLPSRLRLS
jgi:hypothetical protein